MRRSRVHQWFQDPSKCTSRRWSPPDASAPTQIAAPSALSVSHDNPEAGCPREPPRARDVPLLQCRDGNVSLLGWDSLEPLHYLGSARGNRRPANDERESRAATNGGRGV